MNPEFKKNIWLEVSFARLLVMPLVLTSIFVLAFVSNRDHPGVPLSIVRHYAISIYSLIIFVWGAKLSADSIGDEVQDHTWDGQRMSLLTPWQLTWGKLFGATIFSWYGGLFCLALIFSIDFYLLERTTLILNLVIGGIMAHAASLLTIMLLLHKDRKLGRGKSLAILLGILVATSSFQLGLVNSESTMVWYGLYFNKLYFWQISLVVFALWLVLGVYKIFRLELQMKNYPTTWCLFMFFSIVYVSGFTLFSHKENVTMIEFLFTSFLVCSGFTYLMLFLEKKDFISIAVLAQSFKRKDFKKFFYKIPRWAVSFLGVLFTAAIAIIVHVMFKRMEEKDFISLVLSALFFLGRDILIVLTLNFIRPIRQADLIGVLCLAMLYGIIPLIFRALEMNKILFFFWPVMESYGWIGPFIELMIFGSLFFMISKKLQKETAIEVEIS